MEHNKNRECQRRNSQPPRTDSVHAERKNGKDYTNNHNDKPHIRDGVKPPDLTMQRVRPLAVTPLVLCERVCGVQHSGCSLWTRPSQARPIEILVAT
jgi:hypothetical protein